MKGTRDFHFNFAWRITIPTFLSRSWRWEMLKPRFRVNAWWQALDHSSGKNACSPIPASPHLKRGHRSHSRDGVGRGSLKEKCHNESESKLRGVAGTSASY